MTLKPTSYSTSTSPDLVSRNAINDPCSQPKFDSLKVPVILDHDIGTNPDDFYAFDYVLGHSKAQLLFTVSGNRAPTERAQLARYILDLYQRSDIPSYAGEPDGCVEFYCQHLISGEEQTDDNYLPAVRDALENYPRVVYICIQGLSNVARILREYPDLNERLLIYHLGLTTTGYEQITDGGTNMRADPDAAQYVYETAKNLWSVGLQTTLRDDLRVSPGTEIYNQLRASCTELGYALRSHSDEFFKRRHLYPAMHDGVAVSAALQDGLVDFKTVTVDFVPNGYVQGEDVPVCVSKEEINADKFMTNLAGSIRTNKSL